MSALKRSIFWLCFAIFFCPTEIVFGGQTSVLHYKGFSIDFQEGADSSSMETELREQIDMVSSVEVSKEVMDFFHTVPIKVVPFSDRFGFELGFYSVADKDIQFSTSLIGIGHKPILIHELLHAFHMQRIDGNIYNPTIIKFYHQAKSLGIYSPSSHMMLNNWEFFACSGTTYLFGETAQEPFFRDKVRMSQPEWFEYMKTLFGPTSGRYAGSLKE
jgi:hypothetical protein